MYTIFRSAGLALLGCLLLYWTVEAATIKLTWDYPSEEVAGITGFLLERRQGTTGEWVPLPLAILPEALMTQDTTAAEGLLYCYRLFAVNTPYRSIASNEVCAAIPKAPTNLRAVP